MFRKYSLILMLFFCFSCKVESTLEGNTKGESKAKILYEKNDWIIKNEDGVEVEGHITLDFEHMAIYKNDSEEKREFDPKTKIYKEAIWINLPYAPEKKLKFKGKVKGKLVEGVTGHAGRYGAKIDHVKIFDHDGNEIKF